MDIERCAEQELEEYQQAHSDQNQQDPSESDASLLFYICHTICLLNPTDSFRSVSYIFPTGRHRP